ncbi:MAG TPA: polysaccharide pyruvyl transferase family protein [Bryobacteraceae bacterium]|jgi:polysaccharide pyruvyl transferase WcaK-like protein|nr:polysaccharide pyruvyl transferase family protein [Bryobacteraceae bacterium]
MVIGLLDHMGYGNLGDAAVQESVIANIRKRVPNPQFIGFSLIPGDTTKRHGIPAYPILRWYPRLDQDGTQVTDREAARSTLKSVLKRAPRLYALAKLPLEAVREAVFWARSYRALRSLDLLIISGGGQLGELWRGPWSHPFTILKFSLLAKLARRKLYFLNVGAGPLRHPLSRLFVRWAVGRADYLSFRDDDSADLIRSLGVKSKIHVHPDPAYALDVGHHAKSAPRNSSTPVVGLNPIGFCDSRIWPRKNDPVYHEYLRKITQFSVWLLMQGYDLRVFTTDPSVDGLAIEDLRAQLSLRLSPEMINRAFGPPAWGVEDVLQVMSACDFIVTPKFHGIIFSQLLGKPVIALSYHRKMEVAMQAVDQGRFCTDIEHFDSDWLTAAFLALTDESSGIRMAQKTAVEARLAILTAQFDHLFLNDASRGPDDARRDAKRLAQPA